jgi:DNA-binding MarR family transcriptional regulator
MATAPESFAQFGYTLALAERTLTAVLRKHLAERGVEPETWYALQLVATRGPRLSREALSADLAQARTLDAESTRALLARLEADGLIDGDAEVELTAAGTALHRSLREYVAIPRNRLLSELDAGDVETTIRTLQRIAERAAQEQPV